MRHVLAAKFLGRIEKPARGGLTPVASAFLPPADLSAMIRLAPRRQLQQQGQMHSAKRFLSSRRRQAG
jgi:hypothetical protein